MMVLAMRDIQPDSTMRLDTERRLLTLVVVLDHNFHSITFSPSARFPAFAAVSAFNNRSLRPGAAHTGACAGTD
jgi:hypothetical protein